MPTIEKRNIVGNSLVPHSENAEAAAKGTAILQLVTFKLGEEQFAVDILKVQEINRMTAITKMPNSPHEVEGIVNLRGKVIPIVNLRKKIGMPEKENDEHSRIMIMNIQGITMGLIVDAVDEVLRIPVNIVESSPTVAMGISSELIKGIAKLEDRLIVLINLQSLFGIEDIALIESL
ncbi:MAG: chemotaxis protein CheW [Nitrospirae bacterium]|nr:chemotaxis protein CheW [Nitrospirota bacterium]